MKQIVIDVTDAIIIMVLVLLIIFLYNHIDGLKENVESKINNTIQTLSENGFSNKITSKGSLIKDKEKLEDSGISGENYRVNTALYPYFEQLSSSEKKVYKQIYANALEMKTTFVPVVNIKVDRVKDVFESVYDDHPELFWLNTGYSYLYTNDENCVQITLSFNETANYIETAKKDFENNAQAIISGATRYSSDFEKEKYVHDAIIKKVTYDTGAAINQSAYSALVNGRSVCAGYARAFQYIMIKLGIPTYYVSGYAKEDHAWNIVYLSDGYYNVDLTWDDQRYTIYDYFNVPDSTFNTSHTRTGLSKTLPPCNGSKYVYDGSDSGEATTVFEESYA